MDTDAEAAGLEGAPALSALSTIEPRDDVAVTVPPDQSGIIRCHLGFGIELLERDDGRCGIAVCQTPLNAHNPEMAALREFMETTAVEWLRQVAPHRLQDSFSSEY